MDNQVDKLYFSSTVTVTLNSAVYHVTKKINVLYYFLSSILCAGVVYVVVLCPGHIENNSWCGNRGICRTKI